MTSQPSGIGCPTICSFDFADGTSVTLTATPAPGFGGICQPRLLVGVACGAHDECASGSCVDSVCCTTACDGQCETRSHAGRRRSGARHVRARRPAPARASGLQVGDDRPRRDLEPLIAALGALVPTTAEVERWLAGR